MKKTPHDYQLNAKQWSNQQFNQSIHHALVMPAGSGKTFVAALLIKDRISLGKKLLVICGTEEIFDQWIEELSENDIDYGYINQEGVMGRNKSVYVCMWLSLFNNLNRLPEKFCKQFSEIITDEFHHASSTTIETIYDFFHWCIRLGLTATLYRMDNKPLGKYCDKMYEPITQREAIERGFLCEPIIILPEIYSDNVPTNIEDLNIKKQRELIREKKIIGDPIGFYNDVFDGELCLVACSGHKHAQIIAQMYKDQGWIVEHIHSGLNKVDRRSIIRRARQGKINILVTYDVGKEGLNIKNIMGVIWLILTESLVKWIQMNTRAARMIGSKKNYVLYDAMGNIILHGRPDINRKWLLDTDYEPGQDNDENLVSRICAVCGVVNSLQNTKCWICEYDFILKLDADGNEVDSKIRKLPKMIDGNLVFLDDKFNGGGDGNRNRPANIDNNSNDNNNSSEIIEPKTKAEKIQLMSKDLTGLRLKNKFREGVKWL